MADQTQQSTAPKDAPASSDETEKPSQAQQKREAKAAEEAMEAEAIAQAEARKTETVGVKPTPADIDTEADEPRKRYVHCTVDGCKESRCEVYQGDNPEKIDTAWCPLHARVSIKSADDEDEEQ